MSLSFKNIYLVSEAQSLKHLLQKLEDLSSSLSTDVKKPGMVLMHSCNLSARVAQTGGFL